MTGYWQWSGDNHLYISNARSEARFGQLMLHKGVWDGTRLINEDYVSSSITKSQDINKSYGYLWWLNGAPSYRVPQSQFEIPGMLMPDAPADTYSAIGKNGQYVSISPSEDMVIIRMGENPEVSLVPARYLNNIWRMVETLDN